MNLRSKNAFWPIEAGLLHSYPALKQDEACDVAIIGAGVTGALLAHKLSKEGKSCVVLDSGHIGGGSTSASTALLQYEVDTPLYELIEKRGEADAVRAYRLCFEAIDKIQCLAGELNVPVGFRKVPSLYLASTKKDLESLEKEFKCRRLHGFDVSMPTSAEIGERFHFESPGALWTEQAAEINPYRFAHALLNESSRRNVKIHDRTEVEQFESHAHGVTLTSTQGFVIEARKVIFATGYVTPSFLDQNIVDLNSTFAFISEPVDFHWYRECLIWESAKPYCYLRSTPDGRILVGGMDEKFTNPEARDALVDIKAEALRQRFCEMFPGVDLEPAYAWAGTFGETKDGLGYIGENSKFPNSFFALGYGGNGITYSVIAADIICDLILGNSNTDASIFRFDR